MCTRVKLATEIAKTMRRTFGFNTQKTCALTPATVERKPARVFASTACPCCGDDAGCAQKLRCLCHSKGHTWKPRLFSALSETVTTVSLSGTKNSAMHLQTPFYLVIGSYQKNKQTFWSCQWFIVLARKRNVCHWFGRGYSDEIWFHASKKPYF